MSDAEPVADQPVALDLGELLVALSDLSDAVVKSTERVEELERNQQDLEKLALLIEEHCAIWTIEDELPEWVNDWLIPTFALDVVLKNWIEEPALRSELQALKLGYQAMAASAARPNFDAISWHDALARMVDRVSAHREHRAAADHAASTSDVAGDWPVDLSDGWEVEPD